MERESQFDASDNSKHSSISKTFAYCLISFSIGLFLGGLYGYYTAWGDSKADSYHDSYNNIRPRTIMQRQIIPLPKSTDRLTDRSLYT